jgi:hypothetical protein
MNASEEVEFAFRHLIQHSFLEGIIAQLERVVVDKWRYRTLSPSSGV